MLDTFGIALGDAGGDAQRAEKRDHELVALAAATSKTFAGGGEEYGAVGLGVDEFFALQASDGANDGDVAHAHDLGEVDDASLAPSGDEHGDRFDVVLGEFAGVGGADGGVRGRAARDGRSGGRTSAGRARHWGDYSGGEGGLKGSEHHVV